MSLPAKFSGKFPDVDTHAAGVTGAELSERAGVNTEHGYAELSGFHEVPYDL
jgi:hypothetical protein